MRKAVVLVMSLACSWSLSALAEGASDRATVQPGRPAHTVQIVLPIFSELLMLSYPAGFKLAYEKSEGSRYINELILAGETLKTWSQMVTITGTKALAAAPNVTPQALLGQIAGGFKSSCPNTFSAMALGQMKISGHDAFVALAGCGALQSAGQMRSETALLIAIKGLNDYYTVQWAERGPALDRPVYLGDRKWQERLRILGPLKVCPRVPGEAAPFPSCVSQK
jgi:hypothetical protein